MRRGSRTQGYGPQSSPKPPPVLHACGRQRCRTGRGKERAEWPESPRRPQQAVKHTMRVNKSVRSKHAARERTPRAMHSREKAAILVGLNNMMGITGESLSPSTSKPMSCQHTNGTEAQRRTSTHTHFQPLPEKVRVGFDGQQFFLACSRATRDRHGRTDTRRHPGTSTDVRAILAGQHFESHENLRAVVAGGETGKRVRMTRRRRISSPARTQQAASQRCTLSRPHSGGGRR